MKILRTSLILSFLTIMISCSEKPHPTIVLTRVSYWPPNSHFDCNIISRPPTDSIIILSYSEEDLKYGDSLMTSLLSDIKYSKNLSLEELEEILEMEGFNNTMLRESVFWLSQLSNANVTELRNEFGDLNGYSVTNKQNHIPRKYYRITNGALYLEDVVLAEINNPDGSKIKYSLKLEDYSWRSNSILDTHTFIDIDTTKYFVRKPYRITLAIEIVSVLHVSWAYQNLESYKTGYYQKTFCYNVLQ